MSTTYTIRNMRVVRTSEKMAEKYPDRWVTVHGQFFNENGVELSISSKVLTYEDAENPITDVDLDNGTLTIESGEKGRKKSESISQDDILADLKRLRK